MRSELRKVLLRDNPWLEKPGTLKEWLASHLPSPYVPRTTVARNTAHWRSPNRAHLVVGPRQAGKSTSIWAHLAELGEPALSVDCEQPLVQEWCRSAPLFLAELEAAVERPVTLFFEEAQHLDNAGLFLKGLVDRKTGAPILVTGSSSFHLGARVRESLAGRATRSRLLPFSLAEVCADLADQPPLVRAERVEQRFARHLTVGGYPDVWLSPDPGALLTDLGEALVLRDASDLFRINRPDAFRRLLRLAAAQTGSLVNLSEWAAILGISRDTVAAYLEILEAGHIVAVLRPFAGGRRSELTRAQKLFFVDSGIRHHLVGDLRALEERADAGAALEGWVFSELWKALPANADLGYWRSTSKAEVDFVVSTGALLLGVEVKAALSGRARVSRSARSFIEAYRPSTFVVVQRGGGAVEELGTTTVRWISPAQVSSLVDDLLR